MSSSPRASNRFLPALLFGLSFCLLAYEVDLLRVLTWLQWYHFAYLVISLALLGFGASGTLMHIFRPFWERHFQHSLAGALLLTGLSMAAVKPLLAVIPQDTFLAVWQPTQLIWLVALGLVLFLPFLTGAFAMILVFANLPGRIGLYYASNLLGSGTGAIFGLLMLYRWHPLEIPSLLGLATASLLFMYTYTLIAKTERISEKITWQLISMAGLVLILVAGWMIPLRPEMSPYKGLSRARLMPDTEVVAKQTTPLGVLTVLRGPTLRSVTGLSLSYTGNIPPQAIVYQDGNSAGVAPSSGDTTWSRSLRHTSYVLPYRVGRFGAGSSSPRVLVLQAGPGAEVQQALIEGSPDVTAVVRNEGLVRVLEESLRDYSGGHTIYHDPRVQLELTEPRNYLYQNRDPFDIISMPPVGGVMSASAAMTSIYEDHLLTVEGVSAMLQRLTPEGMLCLTTWLDHPPRRPLKLFGLLAAALVAYSAEPVPFPGAHLVAISSWNVVTMVLSRKAWTPGELEQIRQFAQEQGFDLLYHPQQESSVPGPVFHQLSDTSMVANLKVLAGNSRNSESLTSGFYLTPPTDSRPYFHHFLTLKALPMMRDTYGTAGLMLSEWGFVLLYVTFLLLIAGGAALILLPLWISERKHRPRRNRLAGTSKQRYLYYFGAIGCGFMLVEIVLIQQLLLLLGDPVYAAAAVIAALLVFAGVGSLLSQAIIQARWRSLMLAGAVVLVMLLIIFLGAEFGASVLAAASRWARFTVVVGVLSPLAVAMGVFFPSGIRRLEESAAGEYIPWAWGINGFASVITTPIATILALNLGFPAVAALGGGCYVVSVIAFRWWSIRQPNQPTPVA
ncbi:hypothetical protein ACFL5M_00685 [Candidatus Neomarinimicrobiota bacterium]